MRDHVPPFPTGRDPLNLPRESTLTEPSPTHRLFLLGAGFSREAGLPLARELGPLVEPFAARHFRADGPSHLERALEAYRAFLEDTAPGTPFDFEEFGAWLDWEHVLRLKGSDTFSEHGNQAGLQLRWAIGRLLHERTPSQLPQVYLDFASRLNPTDRVITLNYDLVLETALECVGTAYRRFPAHYESAPEGYLIVDDRPEIVISKLHGSIDWTYPALARHSGVPTSPLVQGPRADDDPLSRVRVIQRDHLDAFYESAEAWWSQPVLLMPPSTAKPLRGSELVPLWDGVGIYAYMLGGFTVIGCSLPRGDPYLLQLIHHIAVDYASGRNRGAVSRPQQHMCVVDYQKEQEGADEFQERFRFFDPVQTVFVLDGLNGSTLDAIFAG